MIGVANPRMLERMAAQEAERADLESRLAALEPSAAAAPITLHPGAAANYARIVGRLRDHLADAGADRTTPESRQLVDSVRALVMRIVVTPQSLQPRAPVDIELHGDLARFLAPPGLAPPWGGQMVAGGRYSLAPPSLPVAIRV